MRLSRTFYDVHSVNALEPYDDISSNIFLFIFVCSANLKLEDCFNYLETKAKYANDKCLKRLNFQTAVDQIEQAIATGEDAAPLDVSVVTI